MLGLALLRVRGDDDDRGGLAVRKDVLATGDVWPVRDAGGLKSNPLGDLEAEAEAEAEAEVGSPDAKRVERVPAFTREATTPPPPSDPEPPADGRPDDDATDAARPIPGLPPLTIAPEKPGIDPAPPPIPPAPPKPDAPRPGRRGTAEQKSLLAAGFEEMLPPAMDAEENPSARGKSRVVALRESDAPPSGAAGGWEDGGRYGSPSYSSSPASGCPRSSSAAACKGVRGPRAEGGFWLTACGWRGA